jgi:hypothetical protein
MDRLDTYQAAIKRILIEHQTRVMPESRVEKITIADDVKGHYLLLEIGWEMARRLEQIILYVRIHDDKIWIEVDWTESGIAQELLEAGVPKEAIVLAFHHPDKRPYTEFAPA